jgi:elongation factor Ts
MHNAVKDGLGKIGVLVALESDGDVAKLEEFGKKIAMHIAATAPAALSEGDIPAERIDRERGIILESIKEDPKLAGKPQNVIDGAVTGKLRKVLQDIVLTKQAFVMNPDQTIEQAVEETAKALGQPVKLAAFVRFQLGDGVEKKTDDFAKEVAALTGQG